MPSKKNPITETVEIYPAGRGKILAIIKKSLPKKPKTYKRKNPRYNHMRIRMNPESLTITEYLNNSDGRKHIYIFPQAYQLNYEERERFALALLLTLPRIRGMGNSMKLPTKFPVFLTTQQRKILKKEWRRYMKWRRKQS